MFDDFALSESIEEIYNETRYARDSCDSCGERFLITKLHYFQSFDDSKVHIKMCERCYHKLLGRKEKRNP